ncbi:MAG: sulfite exporter TauE/SafE family protein [Pseudomonadota bacterium]
MSDLLVPIALAGVGIIAGWLNVLAGGGSLLTVPALMLAGLPGPVANGTNRIAILAQNTVAVSTFFRRGYSDFRLSLSLAAAAVPGAVAGAMVGTRLDGRWFDWVLAAVMVLVMVVMARKKSAGKGSTEDAPTVTPRRLLWGHVLMVGAGFWGGFIQIGVGFVLMPILHRVIGLDLVRVNMHKVFIVLVYTCVALAVFASQVRVEWVLGLSLAVGNSIGGWLGAHTAVVRGERVIRVVLNVVLVAFIAKLLFL